MGVLWAHTGAIVCIGLIAVVTQNSILSSILKSAGDETTGMGIELTLLLSYNTAMSCCFCVSAK